MPVLYSTLHHFISRLSGQSGQPFESDIEWRELPAGEKSVRRRPAHFVLHDNTITMLNFILNFKCHKHENRASESCTDHLCQDVLSIKARNKNMRFSCHEGFPSGSRNSSLISRPTSKYQQTSDIARPSIDCGHFDISSSFGSIPSLSRVIPVNNT